MRSPRGLAFGFPGTPGETHDSEYLLSVEWFHEHVVATEIQHFRPQLLIRQPIRDNQPRWIPHLLDFAKDFFPAMVN